RSFERHGLGEPEQPGAPLARAVVGNQDFLDHRDLRPVFLRLHPDPARTRKRIRSLGGRRFNLPQPPFVLSVAQRSRSMMHPNASTLQLFASTLSANGAASAQAGDSKIHSTKGAATMNRNRR